MSLGQTSVGGGAGPCCLYPVYVLVSTASHAWTALRDIRSSEGGCHTPVNRALPVVREVCACTAFQGRVVGLSPPLLAALIDKNKL